MSYRLLAETTVSGSHRWLPPLPPALAALADEPAAKAIQAVQEAVKAHRDLDEIT